MEHEKNWTWLINIDKTTTTFNNSERKVYKMCNMPKTTKLKLKYIMLKDYIFPHGYQGKH